MFSLSDLLRGNPYSVIERRPLLSESKEDFGSMDVEDNSANLNEIKLDIPEDIFQSLKSEFSFDYLPPTTVGSLAGDWGYRNFVFLPKEQGKKFFAKAVEQLQRNRSTVIFCPFRPNTKYFFDYVYPYAAEIRPIKGKIKFKGYNEGSPVPFCVVVYKPPFDSRKGISVIGERQAFKLNVKN